MGRIRTIKPEFFKHLELFEIEEKENLPIRLAFAGLWTACDREGRFKWRPRTLKLDCLPYDSVDFSRIMDILHANGFIQKYKYEDEYYGFVPTWNDHQWINNKEIKSTLPDPIACVPIPPNHT
jgi:hypothetical protein